MGNEISCFQWIQRLRCWFYLIMDAEPPSETSGIFNCFLNYKLRNKGRCVSICRPMLYLSIIFFYRINQPNLMIKRLTILVRIRDVPGLNLGSETGYPGWGFVVILSSSSEFRDSTSKLGHNRFLTNYFQFIIYLPPFHSTLYNLSHWV
jgi:hypothetical protein